MEGVRETVGFVTNALKHEQRVATARHVDRLAATRHIDLLESFGQRRNWNLIFKTQSAHHAFGNCKLTLATINQEQLWRVGKLAWPIAAIVGRLISLVEVRSESTGEHFFHRCVIVVACNCLHLEAPVLALVRKTVFEHDHGTHVVGAL